MAQQWYIFQNDKKYGPYAEENMLSFIDGGKLKEDSLVWYPGMKSWAHASDVEPFKSHFVPFPTPPAEKPAPLKETPATAAPPTPVTPPATAAPPAPKGGGSGKLIAGVVITVVVVVVVILAAVLLMGGGGGTNTTGGTQLYSTNPSNVALKLSDMPSGWILGAESSSDTAPWADSPAYSSEGLEAFNGRRFDNGGTAARILNSVYRYSSIETAKQGFDTLPTALAQSSLQTVFTTGASVSIGDESATIISDSNPCGVIFRKSNFVVMVFYDYGANFSNARSYAQIMANRIT
jgi:hypothetical protein